MVYWCVWVLVRVFIAQRFSLLDKDEDGHLTEDDVMSVSADVVDEAFGQTPPGEVKTQIEFSTQVLESLRFTRIAFTVELYINQQQTTLKAATY